MQHPTRRKRKGWNARCWRIPRARARSSKQTSTIVLEIKELIVIVPDIENILERLFNYLVTKLFNFSSRNLFKNQLEFGIWNWWKWFKSGPNFPACQREWVISDLFLEGGKNAPIRLLASFQPLSRCSNSNISTGIRTHLKLVSENILLDYKNTKWNTKVPAYEANRLWQTRSETHLKLCCVTIITSIKYCIISYEPSDPNVYFPLSLSPCQIEI